MGSENRMCMPSVSVRFLLHAIPVAYRKKNYMWFPTAGRVGRQRGNLGAVTRQCEGLFFGQNFYPTWHLQGSYREKYRGEILYIYTHAGHINIFMCLL